MSVRAAAWLAWFVWIISVVLMLSDVFLQLVGVPPPFARRPDTPIIAEGLAVVGVLGIEIEIATLGALIVSRYVDNLIGWLFAAAGLILGVGTLADWYATDAPVAAWIANQAHGPGILGIVVFVFLLFPEGRLVTPRWRPVAWIAATAVVVVVLVEAIRPGPLQAWQSVNNPFGIDAPAVVFEVGIFIGYGLLSLSLLAAAASLVVRFRRSRGDERQQMKLFASTAGVAAVLLLSGPLLWAHPIQWLWPVALAVAAAIIPTSIGVAILKYRLYDIDLIIRRTLVYSVLTAGLGLVYWAGVILLQQVLRPLTQGSDLAIVGSTLAVAALFQPARQRIQALVDQRFYRARYDAARTLEAFSARLRNEVDLDHLSGELLSAVEQTMKPSVASLWLREKNRGR